ncbi:MAG: YicC family protein [Rhodospirillaceae bacterium]|nr:YicC family protein [Rhodospirillaceae bacterium]
MTGFARATGAEGSHTWSWEVKSVNGKGLDVRCRMPSGFDEMEAAARAAVSKRFKRGNINLTLSLALDESGIGYRINKDLLDHLIDTAKTFEAGDNVFDPPRIDGLLGVRGVVEAVDEVADEAEMKALKKSILDSLSAAIDGLSEMRADEGARMKSVLAAHLDNIGALCGGAAEVAETQPESIERKLREQITELLQAEPALPEERLAQEVAILITRSDVREELDRLGAHLQAAGELLDGGGAVGRKLDFLCQEFTREANTICSKASDLELSRIGLELKSVVEQFREQVQNIE